ncbi:MAG: methylmalonyl Co-A mutase-associated GTPase MeaB [Candidatus Krumholzibacteria bacterium]|jgi:LAO/AO transport system kinase|nr:methylmalonyl Co-A mutase-associated GTPase MeaB [Candidatus Krumholzibacteria bacterium]MDP6670059.1 methylmalonyl Co-A mutase-associated GTPase MeaB [Candidatus Krumholzibacteria bacterium]MDP6797575.1 methylmalonyl Co-A mutase-associated GTPase MeaB [Candidatus Krumholzibacteria bacterium]MDP7021720.1 methylmalonyl Co-A mutase-associated GTPase MeaB [Candidatus Krumholzibacteria bacterium]
MAQAMVSALIDSFRQGDRLALARLITLVENRASARDEIIDSILPLAGQAYRIGITGPPGSGKSTLLEELLLKYRKDGKSLGVIAVDPSSPFSGGALLGDRLRMRRAGADPGVFIRSLGSRGALGGLSEAADMALDLLDAFGMERVFVETVGVGQSELDVAENAYTTVVVLVPESGDQIQTMKAGLMEIGDVFVVNKTDREGAGRMMEALELSLEESPAREGWKPPVLGTCAKTAEGVLELQAAIESHREHISQYGKLGNLRKEIGLRRIHKAVSSSVTRALWSDPRRAKLLDRGLDQWLSGAVAFGELVESLLPEGLHAKSQGEGDE